jgi:hypothetical protein
VSRLVDPGAFGRVLGDSGNAISKGDPVGAAPGPETDDGAMSSSAEVYWTTCRRYGVPSAVRVVSTFARFWAITSSRRVCAAMPLAAMDSGRNSRRTPAPTWLNP